MSNVPSPRWHAWAGLMLGPIAWGLDQQVSSMWSFATCYPGAGRTILVGLLCLLLALVGEVLSWRRWRTSRGEDTDHAQRFFAMLSVIAATYVALIIVLAAALRSS